MTSRRPGWTLAVFAVAVVGCGPGASDDGDGDGGNGQPHELVGITVNPTNPIVELDLGATGSQTFVATGRYRDGLDEDLSASVTWTVANPAVGTMTGPSLAIPSFAATTAEVSLVTASLGNVSGTAQITVVAYQQSGPQPDFFFVLPFQDPAGAAHRPLAFSTVIRSLDVFFLMDATGSMYGEITNLQQALTTTVIPGVSAEVPDSQFGAGVFEDFPVGGYGALAGSACGRGGEAAPDQPFKLFQAITDNIAAVVAGVARYSTGIGPIGCGMDWPEAGVEALYQVATGQGLAGPGLTNVPANSSAVGGVGYRAESMPVAVVITDAVFHAPGEAGACDTDPISYSGEVATVAHSRLQAHAALDNICARVVGVASIEPELPSVCTGLADLENFAHATGARVPPAAWDVPARPTGCAVGQCCTSYGGSGRAPDADGLCPVVFLVDNQGNGLGGHIVTGLKMLARFATFDVTSAKEGGTASLSGEALPADRTTADFIKAVTPTGFTLPPAPPVLPDPTFDATTFQRVTPGTQVEFEVAAFNDFVEATNDAQIFRATVRILAGGCTPLDERDVLILVPPVPVRVE